MKRQVARHNQLPLAVVLDQFGADFFGVRRHVETKLRRDGEPHGVGTQNEMQILLECAYDAVDEAVAIGRDGIGRQAPPER
jgi:hypothetical protein